MRLIYLEPRFLRYEMRTETSKFHRDDGYQNDPGHRHVDTCWEERTGPQAYLIFVETIAEAQGVEFLCPKCFATNGGSVGTHGVICWSRSRGVPDGAEPGPGRWLMSGTGYVDLTLSAEPGHSGSVKLEGGCEWHGHVTNGEVTP